jgi:hypothetical protein
MSVPMWLQTTSMMTRMPRAWAASTNCRSSASVPKCGAIEKKSRAA